MSEIGTGRPGKPSPTPHVMGHIRGIPSWQGRDGLHVTIPSITTHNGPAQTRWAAARLWDHSRKSWVCGCPNGPYEACKPTPFQNQETTQKHSYYPDARACT